MWRENRYDDGCYRCNQCHRWNLYNGCDVTDVVDETDVTDDSYVLGVTDYASDVTGETDVTDRCDGFPDIPNKTDCERMKTM